MADTARLTFGFVLFGFGLLIGLGYLAVRPFVLRSRRGGIPPAQGASPVHQRPIWVVVVLTILTLGVYLYIWFGQSWSELARVVGRLDMSSSSHLWAMAMGFDFFSRVRAHFRTINQQCQLRGLPTGVEPGTALAMLASIFLIPVLVANGQRSLNRIWEHDFGAASRRHPSEGELVAIIALGLLYAPFVVLSTSSG